MENNFRAFIDAVQRGNVTDFGKLCHDKFINREDSLGRRPIHWACANGHVDIVQMLLSRSVEMEVAERDGRLPIHCACANGHVAVVRLLLNRGCQIEVVDAWNGWRPIHWACANGHDATVKVLIESGCMVDFLTKNGKTPLDLAKMFNRDKCARIIEEAQKTVTIVPKTNYGKRHDQTISLQNTLYLANSGPFPQAFNNPMESNRTFPKLISMSPGGIDILLMANAIARGNSGPTVFDAARGNNCELFQSLYLPLWTKESKAGQTLLDVIIQANAESIIEFIRLTPVTEKDINDFLSLDRKDFLDKSYGLLSQWLVTCCIRHNIDWAILRLCRADVVNSNSLLDGRTCLETAVEHRRSLHVRHILHKYVAADDSWNRARNAAIQKGYEEIVELIHQRQETLQKNISMGRSRLHLAITEGDVDMVEYVLRKNVKAHSEPNAVGDPHLMMADSNPIEGCSGSMIEQGANLNTNKNTILHVAVASRMDSLLQWFIDATHHVEQRDCMGLTALQQSVVADLEGMASQLLTIGASHRTIVQAKLATTQLQKAISKQNPSSEHFEMTSEENSSSLCLKLHGRIYPCFLNQFTKKNDAKFTDGNGNSLLHLTALLTDEDGCSSLLKKGAAVGALNKHKNTPLMELLVHLHHRTEGDIDNKALKTVKCLIDAGANIAAQHSNGKTSLQMAMLLKDEGLLLEMVKRNPPINRITPDEFNQCCTNGMFRFLEKIVPKLPQRLAHELLTTDAIRTCTLKPQHSTLKIFLTHSNADVQQQAIGEILHVAACRDDMEYFSDMLQMASTNWKRMPNGESILTVLIREKRWRFCEKIFEIEAASNLLELTDANGNSPLMVAIQTEADDLIDHLIVDTNDINCENTAGDTALSMLLEKVSSLTGARQNRLKLWVKQLIRSSADIHCINRNNRVAISCCTSTDLRREFETFCSKQTKKELKQTVEEINMCGVCLDRMVNRVLDGCGHTLCTECADKVFECPFCRAPIKHRRRLMLP